MESADCRIHFDRRQVGGKVNFRLILNPFQSSPSFLCFLFKLYNPLFPLLVSLQFKLINPLFPNRMSRSYLILFYPIFGQNPILSYFLGNVLFILFLAIFPLILVFYGLFITIILCENIPQNFLASLCSALKSF